MPDFSISSLLQKMGLRLPEPVAPSANQAADDQVAIENQKKLEQQRANMPYWKGMLLGLGTSIPKGLDDIVAHLSGKDNEQTPYDVRTNGYRTGQDLGSLFANHITGIGGGNGGNSGEAAIPFPPGMKVFHGTKTADKVVNEGFNYNLHNTDDILGWMAHFAEDPNVAKGYARYNNAGTIPARIDAERAVDVTNPDLEDVQRIAGQLPDRATRKQLLNNYNYSKNYDPNGSLFRKYVESLTPEQFKATGLDAVRYRDTADIGTPYAWAVPEPKRIINAITGEPMGGMFPKVNLSEQIPLGEGKGVLLRPSPKKDIPINDVSSLNSKDKFGNWKVSPKAQELVSDLDGIKDPLDAQKYLGILSKDNNLSEADYHGLSHYINSSNFGKSSFSSIKSKSSGFKPQLADFDPKDYFNSGNVGGTHGAFTVGHDYSHPQFVVKPNSSPLASASEHIGSFIANQSNDETPVAAQFGPGLSGSKGGTFQFNLGKLPTIRDWGGLERVITDHPEVIPKLQQEHVVDWLIGNHDAHSGQFFFDPNTSKLIPFDKGQAFKYYKADTLSPNYHPNAAYGEEEPVYNQLFKLAKEGKIKLDPQVAIDKATELQKTLNGDDTASKIQQLWQNHNYFAKQNGNMPIQSNYLDRLHGLSNAFKTLYETHFPGSVKSTKTELPWEPYTDPEYTKKYGAPSGEVK